MRCNSFATYKRIIEVMYHSDSPHSCGAYLHTFAHASYQLPATATCAPAFTWLQYSCASSYRMCKASSFKIQTLSARWLDMPLTKISKKHQIFS